MKYLPKQDIIEEKIITWEQIPKDITCTYPYSLAIYSSYIDVKNLLINQTIQKIQINNMNSFFDLFLIGDHDVWKLQPIDIEEQIEELVNIHQYDLALNLINNFNNLDENDKNELIYNVKVMLGEFMFFQEKKFTEAIKLYQDLNFPPLEIIDMFPMLKNDDLSLNYQEIEAINLLSKEDYLIALESLKQYLLDFRLKLNILKNQSINNQSQLMTNPLEIESIFNLIDTNLLKVYLLINPNLIMNLLRITNYCDLNISENLLKKFNKLPELIELYYSKNYHRQALDYLLKNINEENNETILKDSKHLINYLNRLNEKDLNLLLEFSTFIIKINSNLVLEIFNENNRPLSLMARERILIHLEYLSLDSAIIYLEYIINNLKEIDSNLHNKLINWYIKKLQEDFKNLDLYNKKLMNFLINSNYYQPEKIIKLIPENELLKEKTIILSKMNLHEESLDIILNKLLDLKYAEDYCKNHINQNSNIFIILLKKLIKSSQKSINNEGITISNDYIYDFIYRNATYLLSINEVIETLSPTIKPQEIKNYLLKSTKIITEKSLETKIIINILKNLDNKLKREITLLEFQKIEITNERMCLKCFKRIHNSAFAYFPENKLFHYGCLN